MSGRKPGVASRKVLFVIPRMGGGGAERVVSLLTRELADDGADVTLYVFVGGESFYPLHKAVRYRAAGAVIDKSSRLRRTLSELVFFPKVFFSLRREICAGGYDVVIPFLPEADLLVGLCRLTGRSFRYICSERNDPARRGRLWSWALGRVYRSADRFVCQTKAVSDYYRAIPEDRKVVIPNPVSDIAAEAVMAGKTKRVVAAGRLTGQKNFALLIKSFVQVHSRFPEHRLDIYGNGPLRDSLQALIEDNEAAGYIALRQPEKDLHRAIADAELFVLSSDYEGFPNVLLEAMALGLPVVSTDVPTGAARELVGSDNGIVVPVNDGRALADAIAELLRDSARRTGMGICNREKARAYSARAIADRWVDIIQ